MAELSNLRKISIKTALRTIVGENSINMSGIRMLISWEKDPLPSSDSFASFLKQYFTSNTEEMLLVDTTHSGKLTPLLPLFAIPPFHPSPAAVQEADAFLAQQDQNCWILLCEWGTFKDILSIMSLPTDAFLIAQMQGVLCSASRRQYEEYCKGNRLEVYRTVRVDLEALIGKRAVTRDTEEERLSRTIAMTRKTEEDGKSLESVKQSTPPKFEQHIQQSQARAKAQISLIEAQIHAKLELLPVKTLTDPTIEAESVGKTMTLALQQLVVDKEREVMALCAPVVTDLAKSMQELVKFTKQVKQEYSDFVGEIVLQEQKTADRLQKAEQAYANTKVSASIKSELAQIKREIQAFEQLLTSFPPLIHYPLRIIPTCGRLAGSATPCPALLIQWKHWRFGKKLRIVLTAGAFSPSEAVLEEQVTVLPYDCAETADLVVTDAYSSQVLCRKTVKIAPISAFSRFFPWEIDKESIEYTQKALLALI